MFLSHCLEDQSGNQCIRNKQDQNKGPLFYSGNVLLCNTFQVWFPALLPLLLLLKDDLRNKSVRSALDDQSRRKSKKKWWGHELKRKGWERGGVDNEFLNLICKQRFQIALYWTVKVGYQQYVAFIRMLSSELGCLRSKRNVLLFWQI